MKRIFTKFSVLTFLCLLFINAAFAQNITVKGVVSDGQDKTTIPSVSITVKGTTTGTQSDATGKYSISAPANSTLVFTYIGYVTKEVAVANQTTINVSLSSSSQQLDQVVVVGYGTQRKVDVTGSVANLKGDEISKQASTNPVAALQGKIAGVSITTEGTPGNTPQIRIRGLGTIFGNQAPLYVVDGVWYSDIAFLNPGDIENMSILKDASAQSIYGIRAANGVVLITTKKGKAGVPTTVNYDGYVGFQKVTNKVKMANATEYGIFTNELAKINDGDPVFADPSTLGTGTDWYKQILRDAFVTNHNVSVNGGTEKSTYNISLGYLNQDGIVKGNNYKRYTARVSNEIQIFKNLKAGYNITGVSSKSLDASMDIYHQIYAASPTVPAFNPDGSYGDPAANANLGDGVGFNPQATVDFFNQQTQNYSATGNIFAELKFAKHFTFKTSFGGEFGQMDTRTYKPVYYATPSQRSKTSELDLKRTDTRNWIIENTLTYQNTFGTDHNLIVLLGQSSQSNRGYILNGSAQNVPFNSDADLYFKLGDPGTIGLNDTGSLIKFSSYFTRANYSFKNKYLLNASIRADGASQFFGNETWGYFPSVGAGWVISNEDFMKDQTAFSSLKLRGSWGKIGNANVPINPTQQTVSQNGSLAVDLGGGLIPGASIDTYVPPAIVWERGVGTDIGLEAAFLNNRLTVEADVYNRKTSMAIFAIPIPGDLGSTSKLIGNQADIQNRGAEISIGWNDKTASGLTYSINGNIGYNANKVLTVVSGLTPIYSGSTGITNGALATRTVAGDPIGSFYGYKVAGVFQNATDIANSPGQSGAAPGNFKYADLNGDGKINSLDKTVIGNPNPKYTYGVNTSFAYKNFDLSLDFQGVAGVDIYNANLAFRYGNENITKDFFDHRWHGEGTSNTYPSANIGAAANATPNTFFISSGAYFRVRNAQLGYTLPSSILTKWKIKKIRFYANAQNAINLFGYKGFSPEVGPVPVDRGRKLDAAPLDNSTLNGGIDANVYPLFATYNFGINLTF